MQTTKEQMEKMSGTLMQACTEMNVMMRDTMNAGFESIMIATKGCNEMSEHLSNMVQKSMEQASKINQSMMNGSSMNDIVSAQNSALKSNMDELMAEMTNLSQLSSRIAQQAAEPMAKCVNQNMSNMSKMAKTKVA